MNKSESKYFNTAVRFDRALLSLLEKKSFEYITVSEICETAGVNRSTFYLHYENTCDLLSEATKYVLDDFLSCFSFDIKSVAFNISECELQDLNFINSKYLLPYLNYIKDNRRVFYAVLSQPTTFRIETIFQKLFDNIFDPILSRFHYPDDDKKFVMMFYLNGVTAIITEWLKDGCNKSVEDISDIIRCCIFGKDNQIGSLLNTDLN